MVAERRKQFAPMDVTLRKEKDMNSFINSLKKFKDIGLILLGAVLAAVVPYLLNYSGISTKIDNLSEKIDSQKVDLVKRIDGMDSSIGDMSQDIGRLGERIAALEAVTYNYRPTSAFASTITGTYSDIDAPYNSGPIQLGSASIIAYSKNISGKEYTVEQLADQALLLPYSSGDQETYFYGQLDKSGNWDGRCIVNIYEHNELSLITDAQYDSGKLLSCKQAFPDSSTGGQDVWVISERTMEDDHSTGETWRYFRTGGFTKAFTIDTVKIEDIMDADTFDEVIGGRPEGYYCGINANGKYNDDTGNAYLCKFFEDGTVRTLYVGKFKDGQFCDNTGGAWMIGKDDINAAYSYYCGPFERGSARKEGKRWEAFVPIERIEKIVEESGLKPEFELKWKSDAV